MVKIEIPTNSQVRKWVKEEVEKREYKTLRLINFLNKKLRKLEDEIQVNTVERRLK